MGDVAYDGLGALGELVDALGPEALVFGGLASDGEASVYGGDVVIAAFEGHCRRYAVGAEECEDELGCWVEGLLRPLPLFMRFESDLS